MKRVLAIAIVALLFASTGVPTRAANGQLKLPPYKKVKLNNGLTLLLMEQHEVPIISFNFIVRAGSIADPAGKEGLAAVTAEMLRKGTKTRSADQLSAELDFIGGDLTFGSTYDYTNGSAEFIKKDINAGVDLFADALLNPIFPQMEATKVIKQRIDGIKAAKDRAEGVIHNYFYAYLFGNHPYARPTGGDEKSLASIIRADILGFYQKWYAPANTTIAVVGDFNSTEMEQLMANKFNAWNAKAASPITVPDAAPVQGKKLLLVDKPDATQTFYIIGNTGISRTNPDRVQINVINTLFGGRFTSMLNTELRIQTGLTYGARSGFEERKGTGSFTIFTYTRNEKTEEAIDRTLAILKRLHEKGITEEELKSAKAYIKGLLPTDFETTNQLAAAIVELDFYGLSEDDINGIYAKVDAMTLQDAQRIIKQYYPLDNLVFVLIGKASEIQQIAKKYAGKMDVKQISQTGF